ncbi:MAG: hypothetical protein HY717_17805 [Planctomycetes bacterium]|nr:hypothetical protein [Planctomycetota bacterium]
MPTEAIRLFDKFLEESERRSATIKNYLGDLGAFAAWFHDTNGEELTTQEDYTNGPPGIQEVSSRNLQS